MKEDGKTSWEHEYMLPDESPEKPGKYKVFSFNLSKERLKRLHTSLSDKLLKEVLR